LFVLHDIHDSIDEPHETFFVHVVESIVHVDHSFAAVFGDVFVFEFLGVAQVVTLLEQVVAVVGLSGVVGLHDADASARDVPEANVETPEHGALHEVHAVWGLRVHTVVEQLGGVQPVAVAAATGHADVGGHHRPVEVLDLALDVFLLGVGQRHDALQEFGVGDFSLGVEAGIEVLLQLFGDAFVSQNEFVHAGEVRAFDHFLPQGVDAVFVADVLLEFGVEVVEVGRLERPKVLGNVGSCDQLGGFVDGEFLVHAGRQLLVLVRQQGHTLELCIEGLDFGLVGVVDLDGLDCGVVGETGGVHFVDLEFERAAEVLHLLQ